jgi:hypothetical protein
MEDSMQKLSKGGRKGGRKEGRKGDAVQTFDGLICRCVARDQANMIAKQTSYSHQDDDGIDNEKDRHRCQSHRHGNPATVRLRDGNGDR